MEADGDGGEGERVAAVVDPPDGGESLCEELPEADFHVQNEDGQEHGEDEQTGQAPSVHPLGEQHVLSGEGGSCSLILCQCFLSFKLLEFL